VSDHEWSELKSGAMPEDWHERNDSGYVPGGADKLAEKLLAEEPMGQSGPPDAWQFADLKDGESSSNDGHAWQGLDRYGE
jgi:hypothetical protein